MPDIAIIGGPDEPEVKALSDSLEALGHKPLVVNTSVFPWQHRLTFVDQRWSYDDHDLVAINAYFLRNLHCNPVAADAGQRPQTELTDMMKVLQEKASILGSLLRWAEARRKLVLNPIDTLRCHFFKLETLDYLRKGSIPVPATVGTNDLTVIRKFVQNRSEVIYKPLAGGAEAVALSASELLSNSLSQLQIAPVMLQERIYGDDVRAYVLGDEVIASASLKTEAVDFRTAEQSFQPTSLTTRESAHVVKAAKLLGLRFASIDFKRTEKARHCILDVNPAPMFAGFQQITSLDIAQPLAKYLIAAATGAKTGS